MDQQKNNILSSREKAVFESISSIENYYNLKDHRRLIEIILNKKEANKLFGEKKVMIADVFQQNGEKKGQEQKASIFASKYTYENLVDKFKKPRSFRNNLLLKILLKKMQVETISSHQTRKKIWLLASGALFSINNHKGLYQGLIDYPNYPSVSCRSILLDLNRTVKSSQTSAEEIQSLKNILLAFSRRNPFIGYCQGLNFIAYFLLTMQFSQQQCFWLLSQIVETIIPMDYYTNMIGVACDQQIFMDILRIVKPKIIKKFEEIGLDGSVLCIQWFVCLFTSSLPFYLVKIVWDRLLVEGIQAFIKAGIIILSRFEEDIFKATEFYEVIWLIEKGSKNLKLQENQFNKQFDKIYIHTQGLKIARDLYREYHIKQRLAEKVVQKQRKSHETICNVEWPICLSYIDKLKRDRSEVEIWTYRQQNSPKLIHDYLQSKNISKASSASTIIGDKNGGNKIALKKLQPSEYVIGRMEHICGNRSSSNKVMGENMQKNRKNAKFLSMILQEKSDDKKMENLQRLLRLSSFEKITYQEDEKKDEEQKFIRSETIFFYNKFASQNQELAEMLVKHK